MQRHDPASPEPAVLVTPPPRILVHPAQVVMYQITEQDLDFFASGSRTIFTGLASCFITIAVSILLSLILSDSIHGGLEIGIWIATGAVGALGLGTGGLAGREFWAHGRRLKDFKRKAAQGAT